MLVMRLLFILVVMVVGAIISMAKNTAGKILEYKITINSTIKVKDYLTEKVIFEKNFYSFSSYRVQDEYSETKKLENKTIENLINKIYQDLLIKMSETINPKWY